MKNVVTKLTSYNNINIFNNIYFLNVKYDFNEKDIGEIIDFVKKEPFCDILIHTDDITIDVINTIKAISNIKDVWLKSNVLTFEELLAISEQGKEILGIDRIDKMIDSTDNVIDFKKSLENGFLVKFNYMELPF